MLCEMQQKIKKNKNKMCKAHNKHEHTSTKKVSVYYL